MTEMLTFSASLAHFPHPNCQHGNHCIKIAPLLRTAHINEIQGGSFPACLRARQGAPLQGVPLRMLWTPSSALQCLVTPLTSALTFSPLQSTKVITASVLATQSYPTLCDPVDCSPPGSSVRGILQARILEWVAISFSRGSSQPRDRTWVCYIAGRLFTG